MRVVRRHWHRLHEYDPDNIGYWFYDEIELDRRWLILPIAAAAAMLLALAFTGLARAESSYQGGFAALVEIVGRDVVGEPLTAERAGDDPGSVVQQTTGGLLYWSPEHAPTFYDGDVRRALVGGAIREWRGDALDPPPPEPEYVVARVEPTGGYEMQVRLTDYRFSGITYGCRHVSAAECWADPKGHTYAGSTACSWNFALGTRFVLPDGEIVVCNDRGSGLGSSGWLDLWNRPDLSARYGPYATVRVLPA